MSATRETVFANLAAFLSFPIFRADAPPTDIPAYRLKALEDDICPRVLQSWAGKIREDAEQPALFAVRLFIESRDGCVAVYYWTDRQTRQFSKL